MLSKLALVLISVVINTTNAKAQIPLIGELFVPVAEVNPNPIRFQSIDHYQRFLNFNFEISKRIVEEKYKEERNKQIVATFYQELFGNHDLTAIDRYISPVTYIQHNPNVADGAAAFKAAMSSLQDQPKEIIDVRNIGADGDFVYYHWRDPSSEPGEVFSVMDIFRLENGLIVEHWDVQQKVPKQAANPHPMF